MQAYWGNPENKHFIMTLMVEEHEGFPAVLTPDAPPGSRALDYEERLGIPLPIALVGEGCGGAPPRAMRPPGRHASLIRSNRIRTCPRWSGR